MRWEGVPSRAPIEIEFVVSVAITSFMVLSPVSLFVSPLGVRALEKSAPKRDDERLRAAGIAIRTSMI